MKFGRTYKLEIDVPFSTLGMSEETGTSVLFSSLIPNPQDFNKVIIQAPADNPYAMITLDFKIVRSALSNANTGSFTIYNLAPPTRKLIHHDWWETLRYQRIILSAGYMGQPKIPIIFQGNIQSAQSYRQGNNWLTNIEAYSGIYGMQNGQVSLSLKSGFNLNQVLKTAIGTMPNVVLGALGNFTPAQSGRGVSACGNSWDVIQNLVPTAESFIDNEKVNILNPADYISLPGQILEISSQSEGILGTPKRYQDRTDVDIIFEPNIQVGQLVNVISEETEFSGQYIVKGINHRGTISGAVDGGVVTTLNLWQNGSGPFNAVQPST